jgi:hypothetical protein
MLDGLMQEVQIIAESYAFIRAMVDLDRTDNALRLRLALRDTVMTGSHTLYLFGKPGAGGKKSLRLS